REDRVALPLGTLLVHAQQRRPIVRSAEKQDQRGKHVVRLDGAKLRTGHQGGAEEHSIEKPTTQKQVGDGAEQPGGRGWRARPFHLTDFARCARLRRAREPGWPTVAPRPRATDALSGSVRSRQQGGAGSAWPLRTAD